MKASLRSKAQNPLPDYRSGKISVGSETPEEMKHFMAVCRRQDEIGRLQEIMGTLDPPRAIDGKKLSQAEIQIYSHAINYARGTERKQSDFPDLADAHTRKASIRFFTICAAAMKAIHTSRARRYSATEGHRMAALQAKLELERNTGELPTQKRVKERAFSILLRFCKTQDFAPLHPTEKRWSKILATAGLAYLPQAVKGKSR